jgi:hypothetical protein
MSSSSILEPTGEVALEATKTSEEASDVCLKNAEYFLQGDVDAMEMLGSDIAAWLGCSYMAKDAGRHDICIVPETVTASSAQVRYYIPRLMAKSTHCDSGGTAGISVLLSGVGRHDLLPVFQEKEDDSYALAVGILLFIQTCANHYDLDVSIKPVVCDLLNSWIKPAVEWKSLPNADEVARCFFGDVWRVFATSINNDGGEIMVGEMVRDERPPFLPGLCPSQSTSMSAPLPGEIGMAN